MVNYSSVLCFSHSDVKEQVTTPPPRLPPGLQNKLREGGEVLMFQLGFDTEAFGLVFASDYKTKVSRGEDGRETQATVERFLEKVVSSCMDLSFTKDKMLKEFLFTDSEITYVNNFDFLVKLQKTME